MASLPGSIYDLFAGDPTGAEQKQFGALGGYQTGAGEGLTTAGAGEELGILSGDPTKIAQVEAPEITAQRKQIEQQNLQNANFGTRSGGTNASTQAADAAGRANIIDLTGNLIGNTAGAAVSQGTGLLGQASTNVGNEAQLAEQRRQQQLSDIGGITQGAAEVAEGLFGGGAAPSSSPGAVSDPGIAAYQNNWGQGAEPPPADWSGLYEGLGGNQTPSI